MATYVEQGMTAPGGDFAHYGAVVYSLTSAANGTALTGTGDALLVSSDASGWFHVSTTVNTDKAGASKTHRIIASQPRKIGGVMKGMFISFLQDA